MGLTVHSGPHEGLEAYADALLAESLVGVTSREQKSDILTPWKTKNLGRREVMSKTGAPIDGAMIRGTFSRAWNATCPHLNSREGASRASRMPSNWDPDEGSYTPPLSPQMAAAVGVDRFDY